MNNNEFESFLVSVQTPMEAEIVTALLESEGIPVHKRHNLTGDYMEVFANATIFGIDLYVPPGELEKAKEILSAGYEISDEEIFGNNDNEEIEIQEDERKRDSGLFKREFIKIYILFVIAGLAIFELYACFAAK